MFEHCLNIIMSRRNSINTAIDREMREEAERLQRECSKNFGKRINLRQATKLAAKRSASVKWDEQKLRGALFEL